MSSSSSSIIYAGFNADPNTLILYSSSIAILLIGVENAFKNSFDLI